MRREEFFNDLDSWGTSQFLHGEQGALLVASQLTSCAPTFNANYMRHRKLLMKQDTLKHLISIFKQD